MPAPVELAYATGAFRLALGGEHVQDLEDIDAVLLGPRWYDVESSDPRLSGEGVRLKIAGDWSEPDPGEGASRGFHPGLHVSFERLTITNGQGSWRGTSGPNFVATDVAIPGKDTRPARDKARREGSFWLAGLTVLAGDGAYEGLTAYLYFPFEGTSGELERFDPDGEGDGEPFKAVIVNRVSPGFPSEALFADEVN